MKGIYDWVPWFRELSAKIAEGGEQYLIDRVKAVDWGKPPALRKFGDDKIDPLSFLYFLSAHLNAIESVHKTFEIETDIPGPQARVFPQAMGFKTLFFGEGPDRSQLFWRLFRQAQPDDPELNADDLREALDIKGIGVAMFTQALCLTNAEAFLPIDGTLEPLGVRAPFPKEKFTLDEYRSIMSRMRRGFPGCRLYEIGRFLYEHGACDGGLVSADSRYFHIATRLDGPKSPDYSSEFERENAVRTSGRASAVPFGTPIPAKKNPYPLDRPNPGDVMLVRCGVTGGRGIGVVVQNDFAKPGGLTAESRIHVLWINKAHSELAGRTEQTAMDRIGESAKKTFPAFANTVEYQPTFEILRASFGVPDPVTINDSGSDDPPVDHALNQILYGPPGTGKTWNTVARSVAIVDNREVREVEEDRGKFGSVKDRFDELRDAGQIAMMTFHQNYAYEDFIEGIRPVLGEGGAEGVAYELRRGIFRDMADRATENLRRSEQTEGDSWDVQEVVRGFLNRIEERTAGQGSIHLYRKGKVNLSIVGVYRGKSGEIAGVEIGGTTTQKLYRGVLERDYPSFRTGAITSYRDIKPVQESTSSEFGQATYAFEVLKKVKEYHDSDRERKVQERYVLIIDEINRGNIARIFGELITLLEESRRIGGSDETTVTLPYSGDEFGVPENLHIIGTMNTADRSIALLDTALRRRFEFVEMMPKPDHEEVSDNADGVDCRRLLRAMNDRIRFLLDREHQIGHTYFLGVDDIEGLKNAFQKRILPLLQEYFYDNWAKIDVVLDGNGFIKTEECPDELEGQDLVDDDQEAYEVLSFDDPTWGEADAYRQIYTGKAEKGAAPTEGGQPEEGTEADDG